MIRRDKKIPPDDRAPKRPTEHKGETVEQFLARGGKVKKLPAGVAEWAIGFTNTWPGGRP